VVIDEIARKVKTGEVILFLGAGVHASPPPEAGLPWKYPDVRRPLFAGELAEKLASESRWAERFKDKPPSQNFLRVTLDYELNVILDEEKNKWDQEGRNRGDLPPSENPSSPQQAIELRRRGRDRLASAVQLAVTVGKVPSPALRGLAEMNFPLIITTNYDHLFEDALLLAGKKYTPLVYDPDATAPPYDPGWPPTPQNPFIFKMHGDINTPKSLVITDEDYIDFVLRMAIATDLNPVPITFYYRLAKWPVLFLGYSLSDYNLRLLLKTLRRNKDTFPSAYAIDPWPDPLVSRVWDSQFGYVGFLAQNLWEFVPELYRRVIGNEMPTYAE